jgi:hypothetical protein
MPEVERDLIEANLQLTAGNREKAAKILCIGERTLYRKIKEYGAERRAVFDPEPVRPAWGPGTGSGPGAATPG